MDLTTALLKSQPQEIRTVKIGDAEYSLSVIRERSVWIPFKRRGHNRGWQWHGAVFRINAAQQAGHVSTVAAY
jgi:hypothetical protein